MASYLSNTLLARPAGTAGPCLFSGELGAGGHQRLVLPGLQGWVAPPQASLLGVCMAVRRGEGVCVCPGTRRPACHRRAHLPLTGAAPVSRRTCGEGRGPSRLQRPRLPRQVLGESPPRPRGGHPDAHAPPSSAALAGDGGGDPMAHLGFELLGIQPPIQITAPRILGTGLRVFLPGPTHGGTTLTGPSHPPVAASALLNPGPTLLSKLSHRAKRMLCSHCTPSPQPQAPPSSLRLPA